MDPLCSHWTDILEMLYLELLLTFVEKIEVWLKLEKIAGILHEDLSIFYADSDIISQQYKTEPIVTFPWQKAINFCLVSHCKDYPSKMI
jgi:hypothetical protein